MLMLSNSSPFVEVIPDLIILLVCPIVSLTYDLTLLVHIQTCFLLLISLETCLVGNN